MPPSGPILASISGAGAWLLTPGVSITTQTAPDSRTLSTFTLPPANAQYFIRLEFELNP